MNQTPSLACPRCRVWLQVAAVGAHTLHGCTTCAGVWLDCRTAQQLCTALDNTTRSLVDGAARYARAVDTAQAVGCPVCGQWLARSRVASAGVDIDSCAQHGTWFDCGELAKIAQATAVARAYAAPPVAPRAAAPAPHPQVRDDDDDDGTGDVAKAVAFDIGLDVVFEMIAGLLG